MSPMNQQGLDCSASAPLKHGAKVHSVLQHISDFVPIPPIGETFSVEGQDVNGVFRVIGFADESGKSLNPCPTRSQAEAVLADILAAQQGGAAVIWRNMRIVKTTREIV